MKKIYPLVRLILVLVCFDSFIFACTGDCLTCHPKLLPTINKDIRHKPMLTCIKCHSVKPNSKAECGSDCFACHPMSKINKVNVREHDVIQKCRDCHVGEMEKLFDTSKSFDQSHQKSLKDFLIK